jgi:serine/threonine-protein kinase
VSSIALAEFMKMLFEEKLQAQKEALMQGRQLAEIISQEIVHSEKTGTGVDSGRFSSHNTSTASGAIATGSVPPPAKAAKWPFIAIPLVAIAAAGAVFAFKGKKEEAPAAAQATEPAAAAKASLTVKSDPPGAHIWINGEVLAEVTPATLENLPIGKVDVKVGMEGYASKTEKVELAAGPTATRNFTLQKGVVTIQVGAAPEGATATLDGKKVSLPTFDAIPGEPHTIVISAPGYLPKTHKVSGDLGETKKVDGALDKLVAGGGSFKAPAGGATAKEPAAAAPGGSGKLMVSASGGWCNVSVDGKPQGATPTGAVELSAGSHSVSCTNADGKTVSQGAKVNAGETTRVKFSL